MKYRKVINQVKEYIHENYKEESLDLNKIAGVVGMNANYLSHLYKRETGKAFTSYLKEYRINKAKELLLNTKLSISDIAYDVGFNDAHYFTICFKEVTGVTPTKFRTCNSALQ